jgi:hypothetical protein
VAIPSLAPLPPPAYTPFRSTCHRSRLRSIPRRHQHRGPQRRRSAAIRLRKPSIATGANILSLRPASVYAGAANGFNLRIDGSNFAASTPNSVTECTVPVTAADVSVPGNLSVQVRNPNGSTSNSVSLIVIAPNASDEIISLTGTAPLATAKDIIVVDPTDPGWPPLQGCAVPTANVSFTTRSR